MKLSRRYGTALFGTAKEAKILQRRNYPAGQHGPAGTGRVSEYGLQLREKQKAKIIFGLLERQFHKNFMEAFNQTGDTGQLLMQLLERRLDNVVYRLGWAATRAQARQIVNHGHVQLNGRRTDIPSARVKTGDTISLMPSSAKKAIFANLNATLENHQAPAWLELNKQQLTGKVLALPAPEEVEQGINAQLIVEFYSR